MIYRTVDVEVEGGTLRAGFWGTSGPVVVASHGITGNHVSFAAIADELGDSFRFIAPDHRGRGRSRDITGPWGMQAHAADVIALLDHLKIAKADVLVGHSMGGFVAAVTAAEHPDRVGRVLFVDGGLPPFDALPPGLTTEQLITAVIGPAMARLDMTFESHEAYHAYWREHPAIGGNAWSSYAERYFDYDLFGEPPELRPSPKKEAILGDTESQLGSDLVPRSLEKLAGPIRFLRAPRGILDGDPLYPAALIESWQKRLPRLSVTEIANVNHYTIVIGNGAKAVAEEIRQLLT